MNIDETIEYLSSKSTNSNRFILHIVADSAETHKDVLAALFKANPEIREALNKPNELVALTNSIFDRVYYMNFPPKGAGWEDILRNAGRNIAILTKDAATHDKLLWLSLKKELSPSKGHLRSRQSAPSSSFLFPHCVLGAVKEENGEYNIYIQRETRK